MVLTGFADLDSPDPMLHDHYRGEAEHVVWSVPPEAAAALSDHADEWMDTIPLGSSAGVPDT